MRPTRCRPDYRSLYGLGGGTGLISCEHTTAAIFQPLSVFSLAMVRALPVLPCALFYSHRILALIGSRPLSLISRLQLVALRSSCSHHVMSPALP